MSFFFKDFEGDCLRSWDNLIDDIQNSLTYNPYCLSDHYYQVFKHIITSMLLRKEVILLDSDFTETELMNLTGYSEYDKFTINIDQGSFQKPKNKRDLIERLRKTPGDWKITLFTSGTTGIPKKVSHSFESISRFVKTSEHNSNNIWGFAYNPTHMAGIQVFLQSLLNGNSIVRLFGLSPDNVLKEIKENSVTHISATPTFYRVLLPCEHSYPSLVRITSGGEKFNEKTIDELKSVFPNAKITNVYASTEAGTLFASENDIFSIKPEFESLIKVENNELYIHQSLMGESEITYGKWYNTGDVIDTISTNPLKFRFVARKSDMINVGGYKVNPTEVEDAIRSLNGIQDAYVFSKSNSVLGNIICCEVVRKNDDISESSIRAYLQTKIQEFKIPRIFRFVEKLSTTRTGKIKRS